MSAGQIISPAAVSAVPPVPSAATSIAQRDSAVVPFAVVSVWALVVQVVMFARPAIACSTIDVMLSLTTAPHVPDNSPVVGNASLRIDVYWVAMNYLT